jgi:hypothetical protein
MGPVSLPLERGSQVEVAEIILSPEFIEGSEDEP